MTIHSEDERVIREFALQKPVSRLLVNTPGALGGVGATTNLAPALTLGCGAVGGSATSDNVGPLNLINIRRVAYGVKELSDLKKSLPQEAKTGQGVYQAPQAEDKNCFDKKAAPCGNHLSSNTSEAFSEETVEAITKAILKRFGL